MSRKPRVFVPGVPYHVILRGNNRRRLFSSQDELAHFTYLMGRALEPGRIQVFASCPMANHHHDGLLPTDERAIPDFVKYVAQRYAQERNLRLSATGKLFEQRYFAKAITSDEQLALTTAYIELNPAKAVRSAQRYDHWSTQALHTGVGSTYFPMKLWTPSPWYQSLGETTEARQAAYRIWLADRRNEHLAANDAAYPDEDRRRVERPDRSSAR